MADLFSMSFGVGPSKGLSAQMAMQRETVYASLSETTRSSLDNLAALSSEHNSYGTANQLNRISALINGVCDDSVISFAHCTYDIQTANRATARTLMAMPVMDTMHRLGQIEAYGLDYRPVENEQIRNRIMSGIGGYTEADNYDVRWYADNADLGEWDEMTQYDRMLVIRNNNIALGAVNENTDPSSVFSGDF